MTEREFKSGCWILLALFIAGGCTSVMFRSVERSPNFDAKQLHKVMVLALFQNQEIRQKLENEFVKRWKKRGVACVSSRQDLSPSVPLTREGLKSPLEQKGFDHILILRVLERKSVGTGEVAYSTAAVSEASKSEGSRAWKDTYMGPPVYAKPSELVAIESSLYDVKTQQRVWSAISENRIFKDVSQQIGPFTKKIIKKIGV